MSFARAKLPRCNDKSVVERPSTASATGMRITTSSQKSLIPKFRSLSQPPSAHSIKEHKNNADYLKVACKNAAKHTIDEIEAIPDSIKSDEFKDCLDLKSELHNASDAKLESLPVDKPPSTKTCNKLAMELGKHAVVKKDSTMSRKNSSSCIPVSRSNLKTVKPTTPTATPRLTNSLIAKKISNAHPIIDTRNPSNMCSNKKTFDIFQIKKKRYDLLRKEVVDRQKPVMDLFKTLQDLKKKLEENGKRVTLEGLKLIDFDDSHIKSNLDLCGAGEVVLRKINLNVDDGSFKDKMKVIPLELLNLCKTIMKNRENMLDKLDLYLNPSSTSPDIKLQIENLKGESIELQLSLEKAYTEQERVTEYLIEKWNQSENDCRNFEIENDKVKELEQQLRKQDVHIKELCSELQKTKQHLKEVKPAEQQVMDDENHKLKEKIDNLEKIIEDEKKKHKIDAEKCRTSEGNMRSLRGKVKEFETSKQNYDGKISSLSQELRAAQLKLKQMEKSYEKEIVDLNKARNLDKTVIEKLNKDHATFETRLITATDATDDLRSQYLERETELLKELEEVKNQADLYHGELIQLKKDYEVLYMQTNALTVQNMHAADALRRRDNHVSSDELTDLEYQLQLEVVSQKSQIKSLQDKLETNTTEKLRFIETIERMNNNSEQTSDSIVKALVKKEEEITRYETILKKNEETIDKQKIDIEQLQSKLSHLNQQLDAITLEEDSDELKHMLKEGKSKLEQALMKSLENEHKIIKYEHDLAQKNQTIATLENKTKVLDGLIGVIKAKKDELTMENHSLSKYSEEIRTAVLGSKEELKEKNEIIQELQTTIDEKLRNNRKHEKKISELEGILAKTNAKRYKLQETVSYMEKELQATKAQINQFEDMQTRYDLGQEINFSDRGDQGPVKIKITVAR